MGVRELLLGGGPKQQTEKSVKGPIDRVPCPHCGKPNDFRKDRDAQLLDTGHEFSCDVCGRMMEVSAIQNITIVAVRQSTGRRSSGTAQLPQGRPARQATTLSPAQTQRLLRRGR